MVAMIEGGVLLMKNQQDIKLLDNVIDMIRYNITLYNRYMPFIGKTCQLVTPKLEKQ
jgi:hypothetical protein